VSNEREGIGIAESSRARGPAGIIAFERLVTPPSPLVRAYVWSGERTDRVGKLGRGLGKAGLGALMVGSKGSFLRGDSDDGRIPALA
jgi:hypothetical protein